jgi:hypothetical protein
MLYFLGEIYKRTESDTLGGLLGAISTLQDGSPADAAVVRDWDEAVDYALKGGDLGSLRLQ